MKNKIFDTVKKHNMLEKDMHIIVGLSGGPDSVCLFDMLNTLMRELPDMNLSLYAVHVNHRLRPGAAEEDQIYVEELCKKYGVPQLTVVADCSKIAKERGITSEEAGRQVRYRAFSEAAMNLHKLGSICGGAPAGARMQNARKGDIQGEGAELPVAVPKDKIAIALAHNAEDQCETILFRIIRGSGTDGLAGIPYKRTDENGFSIIRPILDVNRREIENYCRQRNLTPRIDHTNGENIYTRNKIRNLLVPYLEENFNENITQTVNRLGKIASYDRDFLRLSAAEGYENTVEESTRFRQVFDTKKLKKLHKAVRTRIYTIALAKIGLRDNVLFPHLEAVDALLFSENPSASADIGGAFEAAREYEKLTFVNREAFEKELNGWRFLRMSRQEYRAYRNSAGKKVYGAFAGVAGEQLEVRTRRAGDRIKLRGGISVAQKGAVGKAEAKVITKKLQDFFVDEKLPRHMRDLAPVLARGSEVLWVLPSGLYSKRIMREKGRFSADYRPEGKNCGNGCKMGGKDPEDTIIVLEKL